MIPVFLNRESLLNQGQSCLHVRNLPCYVTEDVGNCVIMGVRSMERNGTYEDIAQRESYGKHQITKGYNLGIIIIPIRLYIFT
jgi:hypothetical protein